MTNKGATSIQTVFTLIRRKNFSAVFHLKRGVRELFGTLFNWSTKKSEVFSSLWLIRSATSIKTVFTVIIGKILSADFHSKTGRRELFVTLFTWSSEESENFSSLWLKRSATSIQTIFTLILGRNFSAVFQLKTGARELFLTLFKLSSEKSEVFWSLWLIRIVTSIQTVFTVMIGKSFCADFYLITTVRELFLTLLIGLLKRVKFFHPYD